MLLFTLIFFFIALAFLGALGALCAVAVVSAILGVSLRSTRYERFYPYFVWIPSLAAGFAVAFTGFSIYATIHHWLFPGSLTQYFLCLFIGEGLSIGLGVTIATRVREKRELEKKHDT